MSEANGTANGAQGGALPEALEQRLASQLTEGYRPTIPTWAMFLQDGFTFPQFWLYREVELMLIHPTVRNALNYYKGAIAGAEFEGPKDAHGQPKPVSKNQAVAEFVVGQCRRFWDRGLRKVQNGYDYGWIACENLYQQVQGGPMDGLWEWTDCLDFLPRDCYLLTQDNRPVGTRIRNVRSYAGSASNNMVDLWFAEGAVPAKALWYVHDPRYNRHYGQSQLIGAWKPWRRLAWKDGAETVVDGGFYRFAYNGPLVRYPEEDIQGRAGDVAVAQAPAGQYFRYARDVARQIAEWLKTGASVGLPSTKYPNELGGDYKWEVEWGGDKEFNGAPLLGYIEYLTKLIREGIGVPSELIEAAETGSGYSGRAIPLEGFMQVQQSIANAILHLFVTQTLRPLVLLNRAYFEQYGPLDFEVCCANLLETKLKAAMNQGGAEPGMRANGAGAPNGGEEGGQGGGFESGDGVTWSPVTTEEGKRAWKSSGGLIRQTQSPPGALRGAQMSLDAQVRREQIIRIAQLIGRAA